MNPNYNEMSFHEAVEQAKFEAEHTATPPADTTIIELRLHPDGLWTVLYKANQMIPAPFGRNNGEMMFERPLNIKH